MRLTELSPRWFGWVEKGVGAHVGITFLCPHCRATRLAVAFSQPISVGGFDVSTMHWPNVGPQWERTGETFDTLTLSPSIDVSGRNVPGNFTTEFKGHWHGFIENGEIR